MPRVRFLDDFDWRPSAAVIIAYRAGMEMSVTRRCAAAAIEAGKAERLAPRGKEREHGTGDHDQG